MRMPSDPEQSDKIEELAELLDRDAKRALCAAMDQWGCGRARSSVPKWRELAQILRHGEMLADRIAALEQER